MMTEPKSLKELMQEIIEHTDAHNDRSEWRPEVAKLAHQALGQASEFELLRSRNEYLEAQFQRAGKLQWDAGAEAVQTFVNTMIGALESGFVDSNWLSLATVYQVMRNHCKDEFGVEVPPLVVQWGETTARECHAPPAPAAVPDRIEWAPGKTMTREQAVKILDAATDREDPYWTNLVEDFYDEETDNWPSIYDVFAAIGVTRAEYMAVTGADNVGRWPVAATPADSGAPVMTITVDRDGAQVETDIPTGLPEGTYRAYIGQPPAPAAVPEGYAILPKELTAENGAKYLLIGEFSETVTHDCTDCQGAGYLHEDEDEEERCDHCDGQGSVSFEVPIEWSTIKSIWDKAADALEFKPEGREASQ